MVNFILCIAFITNIMKGNFREHVTFCKPALAKAQTLFTQPLATITGDIVSVSLSSCKN